MAAFEGIGGRDRHAPPRYQTPPANFTTEPNRMLSVMQLQLLDLMIREENEAVLMNAEARGRTDRSHGPRPGSGLSGKRRKR
jgi:hypothetical protein